MAFNEHPVFNAPSDKNSKIWRYTDLSKFLSLLDKSALFFPRVDKLSSDDPFEGFYSKTIISVPQLAKMEDFSDNWLRTMDIDNEKALKAFLEFHHGSVMSQGKLEREITFVNSWHCQEHESAAMWSLYLKSQEGIAIQTTYESFTESFANYKDFSVMVGLVDYIDYEREAIPLGNGLSVFMHKRKSFEHEKELRALIWTMEEGKNRTGSENKFKDISGLYVNVDLNKLIQKVYLAPTAPKWILELLESIVKRFGLKAEVVQSRLYENPFY